MAYKLKGNYNHVFFFCLTCKAPNTKRVEAVPDDHVFVLGGAEHPTSRCPECGDGNIGVPVEIDWKTFKYKVVA